VFVGNVRDVRRPEPAVLFRKHLLGGVRVFVRHVHAVWCLVATVLCGFDLQLRTRVFRGLVRHVRRLCAAVLWIQLQFTADVRDGYLPVVRRNIADVLFRHDVRSQSHVLRQSLPMRRLGAAVLRRYDVHRVGNHVRLGDVSPVWRAIRRVLFWHDVQHGSRLLIGCLFVRRVRSAVLQRFDV
jgi:hypothetical protein